MDRVTLVAGAAVAQGRGAGFRDPSESAAWTKSAQPRPRSPSPTPEDAPVTKETPVTKVSPVATEADTEAALDDEPPALEEREVSLGPLFTLGAVLMLVGLLRRRPLALLAGVAAIWLDQRSELSRRLKAQIKAHARG